MAGISITLAGNFGKLDELKDKAGKTAASIKSAFGSNISKAMFAGLAAGAAAAFAGVVAAVNSAVKAGGELSDMVARTGADGAKLFVLQQAFKNAGLAAEQVPAVLNKMQKALAGVNEEGDRVTNRVFTDLGLSVDRLQSMDPAAAFREISESIAAVPDPAKRAALAMEIFGKSAGQLLVMMTDATAISGAETQVGELAQTLADNASELDAVADSMELFQLKTQQLGAEVAVALLPQLLELSAWLNETDFSAVGQGIGTLVTRIMELGSALHETFKDDTLFTKIGEIADWAVGPVDMAEVQKQAAEMADPNYVPSGEQPGANVNGSGITNEKFATETVPVEQTKAEAAAATKAAEAAKKKAEADARAAEANEKSRSAALEEYNIESKIISARLAGDAARLASAEREKKIREEMKRLESAGFTAAEAQAPAQAKVAAEEKIAAQEKDAEEKKRIAETLAGRLQETRGKIDGQQFQSTIGAVSSMQRFGGGGGAVSSGLDYARQTNDLQREANSILRQIADMSRRDTEV